MCHSGEDTAISMFILLSLLKDEGLLSWSQYLLFMVFSKTSHLESGSKQVQDLGYGSYAVYV